MKASSLLLLALTLTALATAAPAQSKKGCPVDGKPVADAGKAPMISVNRRRAYFCSAKCEAAFRKQPEKYLEEVAHCPILENPVSKITPKVRVALNNNLYYFCCEGCTGGFLKADQYLKKQTDVVTSEVFEAAASSPHAEYQGHHFLFATQASKDTFLKNPAKYAKLFGK